MPKTKKKQRRVKVGSSGCSARKRNIIYFKLEALKPKPIVHHPVWRADQERTVVGVFDDEDDEHIKDMHGQDS